MSGQHNAKPLRRRSGWRLWTVACPCGWRSEAAGREDAAALAKRHNTEKAATTGQPCDVHDFGYADGDCWCPS